MITVEDLAARYNLQPQKCNGHIEYIGPNPFESGATEDGFALFSMGAVIKGKEYGGCARDRKSDKFYSSSEIARLAGIEYKEYEASATHPGGLDQNERGVGPIYVPENYDTRTLEERGLLAETRAFFRIGRRPARDTGWGESNSWPTYFADGTQGRSRTKFRDPARQLHYYPNKKPVKCLWDSRTAHKGMPVAYNLNNAVGVSDVWLVGSELAVWLFYQEGITAVCPLGESRSVETFIEVCKELQAGYTARLHVLLDNDKGGYDGAVKIYKACQETGLECVVYDLTAAPPKFDASDLYEQWKADNPELMFRDVLLGQAVAKPSLIEYWEKGTKRAAVEEKQAEAERHVTKEGKPKAVKPPKNARQCPECQIKAVIKNEIDGGWLCWAKVGGCGLKFPDGDERIEAQEVKKSGKEKEDRATELLEMVKSFQIFHTTEGEQYIVVKEAVEIEKEIDGTVQIVTEDRNVTHRIDSAPFAKWCKYLYLREKNTVIPPENVKAMVGALQGLAQHEGPCYKSHVRNGEFAGKYYVDLANERGECVEIDEDGWRIITNPPIFFRRAMGMEAMPSPVSSGDNAAVWQRFRRLVNIGEDRNWVLLVSWLCTALLPASFPCPILSVHGEQGSAKTFLCRLARQTIDPNQGYAVSFVKEEKDVVIAAENSRVFYLDNQTTMPGWLSNLLTAMVTGTPYRCRQLFTDGDEKFFKGQPAILINGIPASFGGIDFNDRAIKLNLPLLADKGYKRETVILNEWQALRPYLLAAILDAMAAGMRNREQAIRQLEGKRLPRMADFTEWIVGCEEALEQPLDDGMWTPGTFYHFYMMNILDSATVDIEDMLGQAVVHLLEKFNGYYKASASELFNDLFRAAVESSVDKEEMAQLDATNNFYGQRRLKEEAEKTVRANKRFPVDAPRMGSALKALAPSLRRTGIHAESKAEKVGTVWTLRRVEETVDEEKDLFDDE